METNRTKYIGIVSSATMSAVALLLLLVLLGGFGSQMVSAKAALQADHEAVIEKTGLDQVSSGNDFTYTIVYSNTGTYTLTDVIITDMLPKGLTYVTDTSGLECLACEAGATGTLTWSVPSVATDTGQMFYLVVHLPEASVDATLTNTVEIEAAEAISEALDAHPVDVEPSVLETVPMDDAPGVGVDVNLAAVFNVPLNETTVDTTTFTLEGPDGDVTGTVDYVTATQTATFDPDDGLEFNALYTATLSKDLAATNGITLGEDYEWTFTPELVKMVSPMDGATGVNVDADVEATFNITITNASSATFMLEGPDGDVTGTVDYTTTTQTAIFDPDEDLAYETTYTATLSKDLEASTGITLGEDYEWTFTTGVAPEPDLVITKTVMPMADVALDDVVTYTVSIANHGEAGAVGVVVTDILPSAVAFGGYVDDSNGTAKLPVSDVITWEYDVASGASYSFIFTVTVESGTVLLPVKNTACFTSTNAGAGCDDAIFTMEGFYIYLPIIVRNF
jgi:uncharacterized repeat protein (TIGR01451 family)